MGKERNGEIEKRLWNIWTYDHRLSDEDAEWLQDKFNFNVRAVDKIVDEAKKEFEEILTPKYHPASTQKRVLKWFVKWFGEKKPESIYFDFPDEI